MAEVRHACEGGLTPKCFEKYPRWAKKVFAYRLMHTLCSARMTRKLRNRLWKILTQHPWSYVPFEYFIFPPDFDWYLFFPEDWEPGDELPPGVITEPGAEFPPDWTPGDPLPDGVTVDPTIIFPPGWTPGDPLPDGVTVEPGAEFPPGWTPGDPLPDGVTVDPTVIFPPGWTPGDPLPDGITVEPGAEFPPGWTPGDPLPDGVTVDPTVIFPPGWTPGDPLPYGITTDPGFRFQIPQLKLMYIFIEPGKTWEEVFPNGWDPNTELPDGASWEPYYTLPAMDPWEESSVEPLTPEQLQEAVFRATGTRPPRQPLTAAQMRRGIAAEYGTAPPLYMGPWEPGPAHKPLNEVAAEVGPEPWFYEDFVSLADWEDLSSGNGTATIVNEKLQLKGLDIYSVAGIRRTDPRGGIPNFDLSFEQEYITYQKESYVYFYSGSHYAEIWFYPPSDVRLPPDASDIRRPVGNYIGTTDIWKLEVRNGLLNLYRNDILMVADHILEEGEFTPGAMALRSVQTQTVFIDDLTIYEK